jgi:AcrR family transcriptional regulator
MGEIEKPGLTKNPRKGEPDTTPKPLGRRRDPTRDKDILEATLDILAEIGFDSMTMDMVAARAKAGKATLYRRWPSKAELVRDALIGMSGASVNLEQLPDTGNLRDDLLGVLKPFSSEHYEKKFRVLAGLGSFFAQHEKISEEAMAGIFEPWTRVNLDFMRRAIERKELPEDADIAMACNVIVAMTSYRSFRCKPFDKTFYATLLDNILLPGLKGK